MRRREVSVNERAKIVSLRQNNSSWLTIEKETTVPRRIAQRAYRDWERSQERDEFKAAHQTVAAEELRNHFSSLKKLALVLVGHFDVPWPSPESQSAKQFLASVLSSDIASEYGAYGLPNKLRLPEYPPAVYYRQNQMLLKSLQDHTDRKLNFSSWESAYDTCRAHQTCRLHLYYPDMHATSYEGKACTRPQCGGIVSPSIVIPHENRSEKMNSLWNVARDHLKEADKVTVIGYSFPEYDKEVIKLFRESLDTNVCLEVVDKCRYGQEKEQAECIRKKYRDLFPDVKRSIEIKTLDGFSGYLDVQGRPC